nr:MAG TPA: hypothetical protein [Caudoviricetes sp.]
MYLGDFFHQKLQYMVCFMLFIYYILLFIIYYYISPRIPDLKQLLYREKKIKKIFFLFFIFPYI